VSRIWLSSPHMGGKEKFYVEEAFQTNWVAPLGPNVDIFEKQLSEYVGVKGAVSLSSGTAALHLALLSLGVTKNDVVICQSFTFAASAFPITYCGAEPVFVDSEEQTWNMDPLLLKKALTDQKEKGKKVKAIIVVHLYGMPAKMDEILNIAMEFGVSVIEDAAEALGSMYNSKACGSMGDVSILSFNGNKIITTSGGGALVSNNIDTLQFARHVSAQAKELAPYYLHHHIGYNYRMSNICAGIGRGQMEVLPQRIEARRSHFEKYKNNLGTISGISFPDEPVGFFSNRWLTTMVLDERVYKSGSVEIIRQALEKKNIETRPLWKPLHQQPVFADCQMYLNGVSDKLFEHGICLPSGSNMNEETIVMVIEEIKQVLQELKTD
jgi:dTDP-4-amino-4,6-dideoxygalactose transaminase